MLNNFPIILVGPPGSGKTTIKKQILNNKLNLKISISATTRKPREGEVDGKDYYFLSEEEFNKWINEDKFIEYAKVYNNYYGTPKEFFIQYLKEGYNVLLELDSQGAKKIKKQFPDAVLIFIMPPSIKELRNRLKNCAAERLKRLELVEDELSFSKFCDYIVVNDNLDDTINKIISIIIAEECKTKRVL